MPNRRKKSFRQHRARLIEKGVITRLERNETPRKIKSPSETK